MRELRTRKWSPGIAVVLAAAVHLGCIQSHTTACSDGTVCPAELACAPYGGCAELEAIAACHDLVPGDACSLVGAIGYCDRKQLCETRCPRDCVSAGYDYGAVDCVGGVPDLSACGFIGIKPTRGVGDDGGILWGDDRGFVLGTLQRTLHSIDGRWLEFGPLVGSSPTFAGTSDDLYLLALGGPLGLLNHFDGESWEPVDAPISTSNIAVSSSGELLILEYESGPPRISRRQANGSFASVVEIPGYVDKLVAVGDQLVLDWYDGSDPDSPDNRPRVIRISDGTITPVDEIGQVFNMWSNGEAARLEAMPAGGGPLELFEYDGTAWSSSIPLSTIYGPSGTSMDLQVGFAGHPWFGLSPRGPTGGTKQLGIFRSQRFVPLQPMGNQGSVLRMAPHTADSFVYFDSGSITEVFASIWQQSFAPATIGETTAVMAYPSRRFIVGGSAGHRFGERICEDLSDGCLCQANMGPENECCPVVGEIDCAGRDGPPASCAEGAGTAVYVEASGAALVVGTTANRLTPVVGNDQNYCGDNGTNLELPSGASLTAVDGYSVRDAIAVGANGVAVHLDGDTWTVRETPTSDDLVDVGVYEGGAFAVSSSGEVLQFDGETWIMLETDVGFIPTALWTTAADHLTVVGREGAIAIYRGEQFLRISSLEREDFVAISRNPNGGEAFLTTARGAVLRLQDDWLTTVSPPPSGVTVRAITLDTEGDLTLLEDNGQVHTLVRGVPWD